eukprot:PhM_4_TR2082/c0_g1_i5/m.91954
MLNSVIERCEWRTLWCHLSVMSFRSMRLSGVIASTRGRSRVKERCRISTPSLMSSGVMLARPSGAWSRFSTGHAMGILYSLSDVGSKSSCSTRRRHCVPRFTCSTIFVWVAIDDDNGLGIVRKKGVLRGTHDNDGRGDDDDESTTEADGFREEEEEAVEPTPTVLLRAAIRFDGRTFTALAVVRRRRAFSLLFCCFTSEITSDFDCFLSSCCCSSDMVNRTLLENAGSKLTRFTPEVNVSRQKGLTTTSSPKQQPSSFIINDVCDFADRGCAHVLLQRPFRCLLCWETNSIPRDFGCRPVRLT